MCDKKSFAKNEPETGDDTGEEKTDERKPNVCYCAYNHEHSFKSLKDRDAHHDECPNKSEVLRRDAKCQNVYARLKNELKKKQQERKDEHIELYGQHNGPKAQDIPVLRYKYQMNEPFLAGASGQFATSIEQMDYKKRAIYGILPEQSQQKVEDLEHILEQCKGQPLPDINNFIVKQDNEELFGLKIKERVGANQWFDFEIQEMISLIDFLEFFKLGQD